MIDEYLRGALILGSEQIRKQHDRVRGAIKSHKRIIFLGNGGSFQGHMAHDFLKVGGIPTLTPDSPSLLTCLANDYTVENMFVGWLKVVFQPGDLIIAVSSSGKSANIINAVKWIKERPSYVITITGFDENNPLKQLGNENIYLPTQSYGVHEVYAQIFLHSILDDIVKEKNNE